MDELMMAGLPYTCQLVAVEMGGEDIATFKHPERAIYLLGAEDAGLPKIALGMCHYHISLPSVGPASYNVAAAGAMVMYDRFVKQQKEIE